MKLSISIVLIVAVISTQGRHLESRLKRQTNKNVGNRFLFPDAFMSMQGGANTNQGAGFESFENGNGNGNGNEFGGLTMIDPFDMTGEFEQFNQQGQAGNQGGANQGGANQGGFNQGSANQGGFNQGAGGQIPSTTAAPTTTSQPPSVRACMEKCLVTSEFSPICGSNGILYYNLSRFNCAVSCGVNVRQLTRSNCP